MAGEEGNRPAAEASLTRQCGVAGPLVFAGLVESGRPGDTALAFSIGAVLMVAAGLVEAFFGVKAERKGLEDIAEPLSAARRPGG
ncbi:hypothetical protein Ppa06_26730 [Planomonospora parontospora subsp. parontospora]|uniref:MFS transporter n=2 Tax=Planomonospora parontospora TaxID=58119 RepID=A0AA37F3U5_9ACTN|nr:hypothetical protein GCM10010126_18950 [Planomonospora parontospora]GII08875.1 hypothetical protein Ppa06_26730 [Planomonospora parontospora subsp. parontospora]